jgi:hypothetical protein
MSCYFVHNKGKDMIRHLYTSIFFAVLLFNISYSQSPRIPRITFYSSVTFENTHTISNSFSRSIYDMNAGFSFGGEVLIFNLEKLDKYGVGVVQQFNNTIVGMDGTYNFLPFYVFGKYQVYKYSGLFINLQLALGYNFFGADTGYRRKEGSNKGGLYYSVGSVFEIQKSMQLRLFYSTNYGKTEIASQTHVVQNRFLSFGIGYSF